MKYEPKTTPFDHQIEANRRAWDRPGYGFLMEMGTGKSKVIVDEVFALREVGAIDIAVIFAPKGTYGNWVRKEFPVHMPDRHAEATQLHLWEGGGTARERARLDKLLLPSNGLRVLVLNIEAMSASPKAIDYVRKFASTGRCYAAVDEASTMKNPTAARTKTLLKIARMSTVIFRRIATGSPVPRGPLDLWSQFEFLQPSCLGFRSYYVFRANYAVTQKKEFGGRMVEVVVAYRNIDELSRRVAEHAYVVRKEDCLTLPPKVYETRDVDLTPEQLRLYSDVRDWATGEISAGRFVTATAVITQLLRLHQIVCGHVTDEEGNAHTVPTRRLDVLEEVLDEAGSKVIIWCQYRRDVELVVERLQKMGRKVVQYHGGTSSEDRAAAILAFQEGDADDFVGTPHAGGYGITLTAARTVVYYSNGYDLEKRAQSEDRAHRIGQHFSVLYVDLVSRGTVDEKIIAALKNKQQLADIIMSGPDAVRELFA